MSSVQCGTEEDGLTGCSASEKSRSGIYRAVCLASAPFMMCSLVHCLVGLVLTSARYITKTWVLQGGSDMVDQDAQCEN